MGNLFISYNTAKNIITKIPSYYVSQGDGGYDIFIIGELENISCHIDNSETSDKNNFETNYKNSCTLVESIDDAIVLGKIANQIPFVIPKNADGVPLTISQPRTGDEAIISTSNFCDKATWFINSERINKNLTSLDGYVWESGDLHWIDMISGRVQDDDNWVAIQQQLNPGDPHGYQVVITVDGYNKTMREPFMGSGGDFDVYWDDGYVKSFEDWTGKVVSASYSKCVGSEFILSPLPGKILNIEAAEADFSIDVEMKDTIEYNVYGYASVFAPQLGLPSGTKIQLSSKKYKRFSQIINEAIGSYPINQVFGSNESDRALSHEDYRKFTRGLKSQIQSIPFRYATVRSLKSSLGLELRVKLTHDIEFPGCWASCTFYCTTTNE